MRVRLLNKSTGVLVPGGNVRIACRRGQALGQLGPGVLDGEQVISGPTSPSTMSSRWSLRRNLKEALPRKCMMSRFE